MKGITREIGNLYSYDGFGSLLEKKEDITNRILYTGQQYDQETGQYYLRARYYNPVIGRYTQKDTYRGDGLNLYAYCDNNPVMYYDPSGYGSNANTNVSSPCTKSDSQNSAGQKPIDGVGEGESTTRVRHYTNSKGLKGIEESGVIYAQDNNRVYMEPANKKPLSPQKAESFYELKRGKGKNYVEFDVDSQLLEWVENPRYHRMELTIKGDVKIKNAKFFKRK